MGDIRKKRRQSAEARAAPLSAADARSTSERPAKKRAVGQAEAGANRPAERVGRAGKKGSGKPRRPRKVRPATRRQEILDAALSVFAEHGFEAARLDDVAARAKVAKGTVYLYFADKEKLFEEVVASAVAPIMERISALASAPDLPAEELFSRLFSVFQDEVLGTRRKLVIRLVIAEGPRFPRIAEFYYRNVVGRVMPAIAKVAERAVERGEMGSDAFARYPQLIAAPLILAVVWDGLFASIKPLDVAGFLRAHLEVMTGKKRAGSP